MQFQNVSNNEKQENCLLKCPDNSPEIPGFIEWKCFLGIYE